jgi:hypothetical protein
MATKSVQEFTEQKKFSYELHMYHQYFPSNPFPLPQSSQISRINHGSQICHDDAQYAPYGTTFLPFSFNNISPLPIPFYSLHDVSK